MAFPTVARGPVREAQRQSLVKAVAALLDEGAATFWELEHQRIVYGATRGELTELLHDLDTQVANEYEETKHEMP